MRAFDVPKVFKDAGPVANFFRHRSSPKTVSQKLAISAVVWLALTILGTEAWYRAHENGELLQWSFQLPISKPKFQTLSLPDLLGDEQRAASWTENDGNRWTALFFKWAAGPPRPRILARFTVRKFVSLPSGINSKPNGAWSPFDRKIAIPFHPLDFEYAVTGVYLFCLAGRFKSRETQNSGPLG